MISVWQNIFRRSRPIVWISAALLSGVLLAAVLHQVDWRMAASLLDQVSWPYLIAGVVLFLLEGVFTSFRFYQLTPDIPKLSACFRLTGWYVVSLVLLPARLGEVAVVLLMKQYLNQNTSPAIMNIIVQRLFDVVVLGSIFILSVVAMGSLLDAWQFGLAAGLIIAAALTLLIWLDRAIAIPSRWLLAKQRPSTLRRKFLRLLLQARIWHRHRINFLISIKAILLTFGKWICNIGGFVLLLMAISLPLTFTDNVALAVAYNFLAIIPVQTIGGIGVSEVGMTGMLALAGLSLTFAASATVLVRVVLIVVPVLFWCTVLATLQCVDGNSVKSG